MLARRQPGEQPEHRGPRRLPVRQPLPVEDLAGAPDDERCRPRRVVGRLGDRLPHRLHDSGVGPPGRAAPALDPLVDQAGQALGLPPLPPVLDGRGRDRQALRGQLGGLSLLPLGQAGALDVIGRLRRRPGGRVRRRPVHDLDDVGLPPSCPFDCLRRQPGQPGPGWPEPARSPGLQPHPAAAHQFRDRRFLNGPVIGGEPDQRSRGTQHHPGAPVNDNPVPGSDPSRRAGLRGHRRPPAGTRHAIEALPSRTDMSQASSRRQSR